jgi:hypothetical protein
MNSVQAQLSSQMPKKTPVTCPVSNTVPARSGLGKKDAHQHFVHLKKRIEEIKERH